VTSRASSLQGSDILFIVSRREFERLRGKRLHFSDACRKFLLETHALEELGIENDFAPTRDRGASAQGWTLKRGPIAEGRL